MTGMLEGKVVAVTGAGRGIGREIALACAREGAAVVVNDYGVTAEGEGSDATPAHAVVAEIVSAGGRAAANIASVADPDGATSIIELAVREFGRIDAVVNNAGILRDRIFHKMTHADWREVIDVHLNGCFYVSHAAARHFREQGSGAYVNFTSSSGVIGSLGQANYAAAKMGIVGLSTSMALDMQRYGVRSNCIMPFAWSRLVATIPATNDVERTRIERLKSMTADKIAPLAVFLCSEAAREVTGQVFSVRKNEIFLFNHSRPIRSLHRAEGWTPQSIVDQLLPALRPSLQPLQRTMDVFSWDPI